MNEVMLSTLALVVLIFVIRSIVKSRLKKQVKRFYGLQRDKER